MANMEYFVFSNRANIGRYSRARNHLCVYTSNPLISHLSHLSHLSSLISPQITYALSGQLRIEAVVLQNRCAVVGRQTPAVKRDLRDRFGRLVPPSWVSPTSWRRAPHVMHGNNVRTKPVLGHRPRVALRVVVAAYAVGSHAQCSFCDKSLGGCRPCSPNRAQVVAARTSGQTAGPEQRACDHWVHEIVVGRVPWRWRLGTSKRGRRIPTPPPEKVSQYASADQRCASNADTDSQRDCR